MSRLLKYRLQQHSTSGVLPYDQIESVTLVENPRKQVAKWATIAHHGVSITFEDTIIYDAQRQITLTLKQ